MRRDFDPEKRGFVAYAARLRTGGASFPWQRLYLLPEPQGHGAFRGICLWAAGSVDGRSGTCPTGVVSGGGAGAVHGFLLLFGAFIDHEVGQGVGVQVFDAGETFFDEAAAAETPGGSDRLEDERLSTVLSGGGFGHEGGEGVGVFVFFSVTDEIVGGEKAEFEAVARGFGFVSDEVVCACNHAISFFREAGASVQILQL